jgi:hypothetical protein
MKTRQRRIQAKRDLVVEAALAWDFQARVGCGHERETFAELKRAIADLRREVEAPHGGRSAVTT